MKTVGHIALGLLAVLFLPVTLPVMVVRDMIDARQQKRIANEVSCGRCGTLLGEAALKESSRAMAEDWRQLRERHPGVKFRRIRTHHAICTKCGQKHLYSNQGKTYLPVTST